MKSLTLTTAFAALLLALPARAEVENLVKNGTFDSTNAKGLPSVWTGNPDIAAETGISHPNYLKQIEATVMVEFDKDNPFLRATKNTDKNVALGRQIISLEGKTGTLTVSFRARLRNLVAGTTAGWHIPRLNVAFILADGSRKNDGTTPIRADLPQWKTFTNDFKIPENAQSVEIAVQGAGWTGTFDIDDVLVTMKP